MKAGPVVFGLALVSAAGVALYAVFSAKKAAADTRTALGQAVSLTAKQASDNKAESIQAGRESALRECWGRVKQGATGPVSGSDANAARALLDCMEQNTPYKARESNAALAYRLGIISQAAARSAYGKTSKYF